jgi:hypothetical protein
VWSNSYAVLVHDCEKEASLNRFYLVIFSFIHFYFLSLAFLFITALSASFIQFILLMFWQVLYFPYISWRNLTFVYIFSVNFLWTVAFVAFKIYFLAKCQIYVFKTPCLPFQAHCHPSPASSLRFPLKWNAWNSLFHVSRRTFYIYFLITSTPLNTKSDNCWPNRRFASKQHGRLPCHTRSVYLSMNLWFWKYE